LTPPQDSNAFAKLKRPRPRTGRNGYLHLGMGRRWQSAVMHPRAMRIMNFAEERKTEVDSKRLGRILHDIDYRRYRLRKQPARSNHSPRGGTWWWTLPQERSFMNCNSNRTFVCGSADLASRSAISSICRSHIYHKMVPARGCSSQLPFALLCIISKLSLLRHEVPKPVCP
jgi:hypothetical protein